VRYYERLGLVSSTRRHNGYRDYDQAAVRIVSEIRELSESGIAPGQAAAFVECLDLGHEHSDDCVTSLAVYRDRIAELDDMIASLTRRRADLMRRLDASASRSFQKENPPVTDYTVLPDGLPVPDDDGRADHLVGLHTPDLTLPTSDGRSVRLDQLGAGRTVIYLYPLTGRPGIDLPEGWDAIPGARGCSTEACDFRDHFTNLQTAGAERVYGMSSQDVDYQAEVVGRLRLPFTMISDESFALDTALNLPTFTAAGHDRLYSRLTLIIRDAVIEHVFYPIFPPNQHAQQVLDWLREH
jgi:peroxiredoxin/DNA-binding transcriptional MerR regulator